MAILTLALGIGANAAIFSVIRHTLFAQLSFKDPDSVVMIWLQDPEHGFPKDVMSYPRFVDTKSASALESAAAFVEATFTLTGVDDPEQIRGAAVTASFFDLLGVPARLGRGFAAGEDDPGRDQLIVLSHGLWARRFGANPGVLGSRIILNLRPYTVIGVMPSAFAFPGKQTEVWIPLAPPPQRRALRRGSWLSVVARLKNGVSPEQAKAELDGIGGALGEKFPDTDRRAGATVVRVRDDNTESLRLPLFMISWAVGCVLLLACTNVAGMMLARAAGRDREVNVRIALGARPARIIRQLLTESVILFLVAGLAGVCLAYGAVALVSRLAPSDLAALRTVRVDFAVAGFAMAISVVTGIIFGMAPATNVLRDGVADALRQRGAGAQVQRYRNLLVMVQIALAIVLLVASALLMRSFLKLEQTELGFRSDRLLSARVNMPLSRYTNRKAGQFAISLTERLRGLPGVQSAAGISSLLLGEIPFSSNRFIVEGRAERGGLVEVPIASTYLTAGFFQAVGQPVLAGRDFNEYDRSDAPFTTVINDRMAKRHWPGEDPIGKRFRLGAFEDKTPWMTIVGVVGDTRRRGLEKEIWGEHYVPVSQQPARGMTFIVRTAGDPVTLAQSLRQAVKELDPDQPVSEIATLEQLLDERMAPRRFYLSMLIALSAIALVLAAVGLYGVLAHLVTLRTQEFGVRMALGASERDILRLVSMRSLSLLAGGLAAGVVMALAFAQAMSRLLYGIKPWDPIALLAAVLVIASAGAAASYIPAKRASRVDPMVALRHE